MKKQLRAPLKPEQVLMIIDSQCVSTGNGGETVTVNEEVLLCPESLFFSFFEPTHLCRTALQGESDGAAGREGEEGDWRGEFMCGKGSTKRGTAGNSQPAATQTEGRL